MYYLTVKDLLITGDDDLKLRIYINPCLDGSNEAFFLNRVSIQCHPATLIQINRYRPCGRCLAMDCLREPYLKDLWANHLGYNEKDNQDSKNDIHQGSNIYLCNQFILKIS